MSPTDLPPLGQTSPSESVHFTFATDDGALQGTVRLCRYPQAGVSWGWIFLRSPAGLHLLVDHHLPCSPEATPLEADHVRYVSEAPLALTFERDGAMSHPQACRIAARGVSRPHGGAPVEIGITAAFTPDRGFAGLLAGRSEVFGSATGVARVGERSFPFTARGQHHEQAQAAARFTSPFSYGLLWSDKTAVTLLATPDTSGGYRLRGGGVETATDVTLTKPGRTRHGRVTLGGKARTLAVRELALLPVDIYGRPWRGAMVEAEVDGERLRGVLNDFDPARMTYARALAG